MGYYDRAMSSNLGSGMLFLVIIFARVLPLPEFTFTSNQMYTPLPFDAMSCVIKMKLYLWSTNSQMSHTGKLDLTDWQMAIRRRNVISITLRKVY